MNIQEYITSINKRYQSGIAREHTYRTDLESLIRELVHELEITNEPANVTDCGNPDYVITRKKIPIGFIEAKDIGKDITQYPEGGDNKITTKIAKKDWVLTNKTTGRIYINETQYFDNIPLVAWEFYIGGYQPAQKWLKDRKERTLNFDDILHYQKIIVALSETDRLMKEIDGIKIE